MLAGTIGIGCCSPGGALSGRAGPHCPPRQATAAGRDAWVNHSLRDMTPWLMTGYVGRLRNLLVTAVALFGSGKVCT
jgi:hypothetical protein